MGTLFLVGTPIGNMEDITLRALRVLGEVSLIAAEDTRTTGRLLKHHGINTPLASFHDYSSDAEVQRLLRRLATEDVALVSDAGMPGLSDPGYRLVQEAIAAGAIVSPIPGPSAAVTALVSSGLPTDSFLFLGFLPRQTKARREKLAEVATLPTTLVLYESPHRLLKLLADVEKVLGDRQLAIGRELTKLYEEIWRGTVGGAVAYYGGEGGTLRGEFTLVVAGAGDVADAPWDEARVRRALAARMEQGLSHSKAASRVAAQSGWRKRDVYALPLEE